MPVLDRTTKSAEDLRNPSWRSETGYPSRVMTLDGNRMQLCPPMAGLTPTIGVLDAPAALVLATPDGTPDPRIPVPHHPHLCVGALFLLLSKDASKGDSNKANKALQDFMTLIGVPDAGGKHVSANR
jgi:hypothetical protein